MTNVMAALPNTGGALCESSVIPFLVPRCKVCLTPTARVTCSNAANIREHAIWTVGRKLNFVPGKMLLGGNSPRKCIYSVPAKETPNIVQSLVGLR